MKDNYNVFILKLFRLDVSCVIAGLIMLFPAIWSIPNSFIVLGVLITNVCISIYVNFMNISMLMFLPLFTYYLIQKDIENKTNEL